MLFEPIEYFPGEILTISMSEFGDKILFLKFSNENQDIRYGNAAFMLATDASKKPSFSKTFPDPIGNIPGIQKSML